MGGEQVVGLPLDGASWSKRIDIARVPDDSDSLVVVDIDPAIDPVLLWSGKRNRRDVPVLPLQRNEVVAESRIARIVEHAREASATAPIDGQGSLFADLEKELREGDKDKRVEFYTHDEGWKNKVICGDSLTVMESLLEYEGLRGRVQMIYVDPPYGIKYDANFQQRIDSSENDPKDQADDVVTVKAFRDTWALGIHSYLSYLQERLYLARELLAESGSVFVQINVENEHLVRSLMDEVFGAGNYYTSIAFNKTTGFTTQRLSSVYDVLLWYAKDVSQLKYRQLYQRKSIGLEGSGVYNRVELPNGERRRLKREELERIEELPSDWKVYTQGDLSSQGAAKEPQPFEFEGRTFHPSPNSHWKTTVEGLAKLVSKRRIEISGNSLRYVRFYDDMPVSPIANIWLDTGTGSFTETKVYAVQTNTKVVERCIAMATDPADIVLDPTCGSGTTAVAAEKLGRRWITCDTSRVAMNIARRRLLSTVFDHYVTRNGVISGGFVYDAVDRVTLKSLAWDMEPEKVELVDRPRVDQGAVRVTGPFELSTLGRYSIEDWKGYVIGEGADAGKLENYITVVCRLYRKGCALVPSAGLIHAVIDEGKSSLGISVGPISGRVTARQIHEAVQDAVASGIGEVHVLGWAFEANVNEVIEKLEADQNVVVRLVMIRPDTLSEGLKASQPDMLFSPLAVPDVEIETMAKGSYVVKVRGVAVFDRRRRTTEYKAISSGYVAAWYLDEDYDGDCFVDCQMFFDFKRKPGIERTLGITVDSDEWELRTTSDSFVGGSYKRVAIKVVDVFGNESTLVRPLTKK
ncbi:MAG: site-specific DNA-methyltransferase [Acidimicrobiales bacterium]